MALFDVLDRITASLTLVLLVSSALLLTAYTVVHTFIRRLPSYAPPEATDNFPITGSLGFWWQRWDWFSRQRDKSKTGNFSFHAGPNTIVGLTGDKGRQLFFESKALGFAEGYAVLFGHSPKVEAHDDGEGKDHDIDNHSNRRITYLLKDNQMRRKLPTLISDTHEAIDAIRNDPSGFTDPFESLYRTVFRLTIRMLGADEIAEDPKMLGEAIGYFEMIDSSATATSIIFPNVPTPAVMKRTYAGARLYVMIEGLIKKRAASDEKRDDPMQYMLDQGDRTFKIVQFIVGGLFAGLLNSGINAAWVMCYLATSPEWLARAREEVRKTAAKYARDPSAPLRYQLDDVPLEAWETEFPVVDLCLRDSIRLNLTGTTMRRNISGKAIPTGQGDEVIPPGAFVTYATGDIHLDPEVYPDPMKWDPSRYLPERAEDKKKAHGYLGWGLGRHPCLGMRFAKLEQNLITAYFIASFDFELQDKKGSKITVAPIINPNGHSARKPAIRQFLKVTPREK